MPNAAPRECTFPGCGVLVYEGSRCSNHPYPMRRTAKATEDRKLYKTKRWAILRAHQLRIKPLCESCLKRGRTTTATDVDHIKPHNGNGILFFDVTNLQSLCHACHSRKTASEDGGFGNPT